MAVLSSLRRRRRNLRLINARLLNNLTDLNRPTLLHHLPNRISGFIKKNLVSHDLAIQPCERTQMEALNLPRSGSIPTRNANEALNLPRSGSTLKPRVAPSLSGAHPGLPTKIDLLRRRR